MTENPSAEHAAAAGRREAALENRAISADNVEKRSLADVLMNPYVAGPIVTAGAQAAKVAYQHIAGKDDPPPEHARPKD